MAVQKAPECHLCTPDSAVNPALFPPSLIYPWSSMSLWFILNDFKAFLGCDILVWCL